jgi:ubiquinone/menaquinone biosynthesis C-methylase UbiE
MSVSARLSAAVDALDVRPGHAVLEIGCGHGVAVTALCERVGPGGLVVAVDRSPAMIAAARRRNAAHEADGRARFVLAELEALDLGEVRFHRILALRVGLFAREPERARRLAERWLRPEGRLLAPGPRGG